MTASAGHPGESTWVGRIPMWANMIVGHGQMRHISDMAHGYSGKRFGVHVGERGRLVLPARVRRLLGLEEGQALLLTLESGDRMVLTLLRDEVQKARGAFKGVTSRSLADELIAERREEARRKRRK